MPLSLGTSVGRMVCVHLMNVISNIFHVINLISSIFGGAVVGPGALKPTVGDGIKSRRPLIILSLFFFFSFFHICIYIGVYNNNNNNNIYAHVMRGYMNTAVSSQL